jgi:hypothetical protein
VWWGGCKQLKGDERIRRRNMDNTMNGDEIYNRNRE